MIYHIRRLTELAVPGEDTMQPERFRSRHSNELCRRSKWACAITTCHPTPIDTTFSGNQTEVCVPDAAGAAHDRAGVAEFIRETRTETLWLSFPCGHYGHATQAACVIFRQSSFQP